MKLARPMQIDRDVDFEDRLKLITGHPSLQALGDHAGDERKRQKQEVNQAEGGQVEVSLVAFCEVIVFYCRLMFRLTMWRPG